MRVLPAMSLNALMLLALAPAVIAASPQSKKGMPEVYHARATTGTADAVGDVRLTIEIDQYTSDRDRQDMERALKSGSDQFLAALKKAPVAGHLTIGTETFTIRWARQTPTAAGSVITLVTDAPVYFVGAGVPGAKPRAGYDVAVLRLTMDSAGLGTGTMAAAARVKAGADTGVEVEDYAAQPLKLASVSKVIS